MKFCFRPVCGAALAAVGLAHARPVNAHPIDEANVYQYVFVELSAKEVRLWDSVAFGGLVAARGWTEVDRDGNGTATPAEQFAFGRGVAEGMRASLDGKPLALDLVSAEVPPKEAFFGLGAGGSVGSCQFELRARLPRLGGGTHRLRIENASLPDYSCVFPRPGLRATGFEVTTPVSRGEGRETAFDFRLAAPASVAALALRSGSAAPPLARGNANPPPAASSPAAASPLGGTGDFASRPLFPKEKRLVMPIARSATDAPERGSAVVRLGIAAFGLLIAGLGAWVWRRGKRAAGPAEEGGQ